MKNKIAGLIPAAGMSTRMGTFKPLLTVGGVSMIKRTINALRAAGASLVVVVTGFYADELECEAAGEGVEFVRNERYAQTQQLDSVKLGLERLTDRFSVVLICPADMPCIGVESIKQLIELKISSGADAVVPVCGDRTGHPLALDAQLVASIMRYEGEDGLRGALRTCGCEIVRLEVDDRGTALDGDTPKDYVELLRWNARQSDKNAEGEPMRRLFQSLQKTLADGHDASLVTIIESAGSTPRKVGASMLVSLNGREYGTIGGGAMEYQCIQTGIEVVKSGMSRIEEYMLKTEDAKALGLVCGGSVRVFFAFIPAGSAKLLELTDAVLTFAGLEKQSWLVSQVEAGTTASMSVYDESRCVCGDTIPAAVADLLGKSSAAIEAEGKLYFVQRLSSMGKVYIFGGGHVSQALVPALTAVDFRCVVLEDRAEFCDTKLFSHAAETWLIDMENIGSYIYVTADDYICIMTRGHSCDAQAQAFAMKTGAQYIGVMGSRSKTAAVTEKLKAQYGFSDEEFLRVTTPIGLDIGAQTPAEIAVSVTAQLIAVRAGRYAVQKKTCDFPLNRSEKG